MEQEGSYGNCWMEQEGSYGNCWPETRPYPEEKLPRLFLIDDLETGETILPPIKSREDALKIYLLLRRKGKKVFLRAYAPGPEEYEKLCEAQRKARRWAGGFGA